MNLNKKAKIFIAMFFFIWTIVIIIVVVHYINERELKKGLKIAKQQGHWFWTIFQRQSLWKNFMI